MCPQHAARHRARLAWRDFPVASTSWRGALWTIVVALDFYWLSNPVVFQSFGDSLRNVCIVTGAALALTLPRVRLPVPSWAVLLVLAYGYASALWSQDPGETVGFTTVYLIIAVVGTVIAVNADARTVVQGVLLGGVGVIATSYYAYLDERPLATVPLGAIGTLAGVGANRNTLSYTLVLAAAFGLSFLPRHWWARVLWALGMTSVVVGIVVAQSGTGFLALLAVAAAAAALAVTDLRRSPGRVRSTRRRWTVRGIVLLALAGGVVLADAVIRLTGRDTSTLSGRVPLWEATWSSTTGAERWFGAGWGAVWPHGWHPAPSNPAYLDIINTAHNRLYHGHSAVFDLLPEVGLVGIAVFALTYVHAVRRGLALRSPGRPMSAARLEASRATLLVVVCLIVTGITEPMSTVPLGWFAVVVLATGLRPTEPRAPRGQPAASAAPMTSPTAGAR